MFRDRAVIFLSAKTRTTIHCKSRVAPSFLLQSMEQPRVYPGLLTRHFIFSASSFCPMSARIAPTRSRKGMTYTIDVQISPPTPLTSMRIPAIFGLAIAMHHRLSRESQGVSQRARDLLLSPHLQQQMRTPRPRRTSQSRMQTVLQCPPSKPSIRAAILISFHSFRKVIHQVLVTYIHIKDY